MELRELNADEKIALATVIEFVVLGGHVTEDEEREIDAIVEQIGEDAYRAAVEEVDQRFPDEEAAKKFLSTITRQEARELIYGTLMEAAMTDALEGHQSSMLDWLAKEWNIEVKIEAPADE